MSEEPLTLSVEASKNPFRWISNGRSSERCGPFQLARSMGLKILSPVTVELSPLQEVQFRCKAEALSDFLVANSIAECWERDGGFLGFREKTYMRMFDFKVGDHWESMFLPNGQETVEWRLGYDLILPEEYGLLICPPDHPIPNLYIPYGYIAPTIAERAFRRAGLSIAFRADHKVRILRGQQIAKAIPIPLDTLRLRFSIKE